MFNRNSLENPASGRKGGWLAGPIIYAAIVLPVLTVGMFSYLKTKKDLTELAFTQKHSTAHLTAITVKEKFDRLVDIGTALATRVQFRKLVAEGKWEEAIRILVQVPKDFPFINRVMLADTAGVLKADTPELPSVRGVNFSHRDWYRGVIKTKDTYVSDVYTRLAKPPINVVAVAVPIKGGDEKLKGILVLQVALGALLEWSQGIDVGPHGFVYLVDRKGKVAAHPKYSLRDSLVDYSRVPVVQRLIQGKRGVEVLYNPIEQEERLSAYEPVPGYGWGVVAQQPTYAVFASRNSHLRLVTAVYGFVLIVSLILASLIQRALAGRERAEETLRKSEEKYRMLFDTIDIGVCTIEVLFDGNDKPVDYRFLEVNSSFEKQTGIQNAPGRRMREIAPQHEEHWFEIYGRIALTGEPLRFENEAAQLGRWYDVYAFRVGEPEKRQVAIHFKDITERKRVEEEIQKLNDSLRQHATQLEAANKELEAFSYSVSHDLRAPLRSIDGFSQAVVEDCSEKLDEQGRDYLQRVRAACQRMAQLIDDMLNLSRVTRGEMRVEAVDLSALAREIVSELQRQAPERKVTFVIADNLKSNGDPRLLRIALENLLGNAWKYSTKHPTARIEFGVDRQPDGKTAFFIRDDGAGFDMAYAGKLFGAFQRLHGPAEFAGTGVGLATVQRIIRRHGGRVWAEGAVEQGATFYFTL